jgi:disulfide bond formation protein DsbB
MRFLGTERLWSFIFVAWVTSLVATLGSLFFSEVMRYPPCVLCWYQRIAMYPLVLLFLAALLDPSKHFLRFTLPLTLVGLTVAGYHNLLYYKILPQAAAPCAQGVSCTSVHFEWLGFITIPLLSFTAFCFLLFFQFLAARCTGHEK